MCTRKRASTLGTSRMWREPRPSGGRAHLTSSGLPKMILDVVPIADRHSHPRSSSQSLHHKINQSPLGTILGAKSHRTRKATTLTRGAPPRHIAGICRGQARCTHTMCLHTLKPQPSLALARAHQHRVLMHQLWPPSVANNVWLHFQSRVLIHIWLGFENILG